MVNVHQFSSQNFEDEQEIKENRSHQFALGSEIHMETVDWVELHQLVRSIHQQIMDIGYHPDKIIAVDDRASSGGYVVASNLAALINARTPLLDPEVGFIQVEGLQMNRNITKLPLVAPHVRAILLVDDVTWSGNTLAIAHRALQNLGGLDVKTCTLIAGEQSIDQKAVDFFGRKSKARDVHFPWGLVKPTAEFNQHFVSPSLSTKRVISWAPRPWGYWEQFALNEPCTVRLLTVLPDEALSLQYHEDRDEFFVALDDGVMLQIGKKQITANLGDYIFVPRLTVHRIIAPATHSVRVLEVSFGHYDQVYDIIRLEDRYGRLEDNGSV
jgi:mannose-6-phosphate isomerase-like protein (cupin superfamily)/adenine/guanine phosphoribosyltransferase-like PRPP-binding protein